MVSFPHRLRGFTVLLVLVAFATSCTYIDRANIRNNGSQSQRGSQDPAISGNGRYTAFASTDYFNGNSEPNSDLDIFLRDHETGFTERISVDSNGVHGEGANVHPVVSDDGNVVAWRSTAANLVSGDTNGMRDVFARDRTTGVTERINVDSSENQSAGDITIPRGLSISADGRFVAFDTRANGLVAADTDNNWDVYLRDRLLGITEIISVDSNENHTIASSYQPSISDDGRYVAFATFAAWGPLDTNGTSDIYLRDRVAGTTTRVSIDSVSSLQSNGASYFPAISGDGLRIAFTSSSTDLVADDNNNVTDVFVYDRTLGYTRRASLVAYGILEGNGASDYPSISDDGRFVAFRSVADNLVGDDTNGEADLFVRDMTTLRTFLVSAGQDGSQTTDAVDVTPATAMSDDGRYVVFNTRTRLIDADTNTSSDTYHRYAPEPGPLTGGAIATRGTTASIPLTSLGWLDPGNLGAAVLPETGVTVDNIIWTGSPGVESVVVHITVAADAPVGSRHVTVWNKGTLPGLSGAAAPVCKDCLIIN